MENGTAHIFNVIRRSLVSTLIAFTLMLSTSLFASARNLSQPLDNFPTNNTTITPSQIGNQTAMQMTDSVDCCAEDDVPCDDDNCEIPCISLSSPHAILSPANSGLHEQGSASHIDSYTFKDGITGPLNAPPPRT